MGYLINLGLFIFGIYALIKGISGLIKREIVLRPYATVFSNRPVRATKLKAIIWSILVIIMGIACTTPFIGNLITFFK